MNEEEFLRMECLREALRINPDKESVIETAKCFYAWIKKGESIKD